MTTTNGNRPILDLKRWESVAPMAVPPFGGTQMVCSRMHDPHAMLIRETTASYLYDVKNDGWVNVVANNLTGWGNGSSLAVGHVGKEQSASASGSSTTIVLQENLQRDLRGYKIHITEGPGAGDIRTIASNTTGSNSTVTVTSAFSASTTTSTKYRLIAPRFYAYAQGSTSSGSFKVYEWATDTWVTLANAPVSSFTDSKMAAISSYQDNDFVSFATGTATSATSTTISNSGKSWTTNQWTNCAVRITGGTGNGQVRTISSNTATQLTVSAAWTTTPDATSAYSIEANDDHVYCVLAGTTAIYRYNQAANTWSTLATRGGSPSSGITCSWIWETSASDWNNESDIRIGRYIYSFRGGSGATVDRYDIASNTWSTVTYAPDATNIASDVSHIAIGSQIIFLAHSTGRMTAFDAVTNEMRGFGHFPSLGSGTGQNCSFAANYIDGATKIAYLYYCPAGTSYFLRQMVIQ